MLGFSAYLCFYHGYELKEGGMVNGRNGKEYLIRDDSEVLNFYYAHRHDSLEELAEAVAGKVDWWGCDLRSIPTFMDTCLTQLKLIEEGGIYEVIKKLVKHNG